jgi:hypothetical protein
MKSFIITGGRLYEPKFEIEGGIISGKKYQRSLALWKTVWHQRQRPESFNFGGLTTFRRAFNAFFDLLCFRARYVWRQPGRLFMSLLWSIGRSKPPRSFTRVPRKDHPDLLLVPVRTVFE